MGKALIIHHSGVIGGAGVSLLNTVRVLSTVDEVTVLVSDAPDDMLRELTALKDSLDIDVISYGRRIGALTGYSGGNRLFSPRFIYRALLILRQWCYWNRLIRKLDPDVVMVNSVVLSWMSLLPEIRKRYSVCFVRETIRGAVTRCYNRIIRDLLLRFGKVAFLSDYDKQSWIFPDVRSVVIKNFVEPSVLDTSISRDEASSDYGLRPESFHLLYVGGVSRMKGFDLAVKAILDCSADVELFVAGPDFDYRRKLSGGHLSNYEAGMHSFIEKNDSHHRIHLVGRQMNMSKCYSAADAVVFPMRSPHQARPVFEAGWYSIPIIISDFENVREDVQDGVNGLLFSPDDIRDLSSKIEYLATHPVETESFGKNNWTNTISHHSKEKNNQLILSLIKEGR